MFSKSNKPEKFKEAETIIGPSIKVKGNFQGQGDVVIEGQLNGSLKTAANIFIGDQAKISANIEAQDITVNGQIHGNVKAKSYLALGASAKIFGDLQYGEISIEKGAIINGQLSIIGGEDKKSERLERKETTNKEEITNK